MSANNEFSKEEINNAIKSLTTAEKEKLANEYKESMKQSRQVAKFCTVLGIITLLAGVVILIISAIIKDYDFMEAAAVFFVIGGVLLCVGLFFRSQVKVFGKSTDEILSSFIEKGLNSQTKWYVDRMNLIKKKIALPYSGFQLDKIIEIRSAKFEYMLVDDTHEEFVIKRALKYSRKYPFKQILSYKILENNISASENAATGAAIGSLFGARGAVSGAIIGASETCNSMKIAITLNNLSEPQIILELIDGTIYKSSSNYDSVQKRMVEIISVIQYMQNKNKA